MRLKRDSVQLGQERVRETMNYKNLNYEIETALESPRPCTYAATMNYKNLNYEIETTLNTTTGVATRVGYEL